jgi:hypothetical protein
MLEGRSDGAAPWCPVIVRRWWRGARQFAVHDSSHYASTIVSRHKDDLGLIKTIWGHCPAKCVFGYCNSNTLYSRLRCQSFCVYFCTCVAALQSIFLCYISNFSFCVTTKTTTVRVFALQRYSQYFCVTYCGVLMTQSTHSSTAWSKIVSTYT